MDLHPTVGAIASGWTRGDACSRNRLAHIRLSCAASSPLSLRTLVNAAYLSLYGLQISGVMRHFIYFRFCIISLGDEPLRPAFNLFKTNVASFFIDTLENKNRTDGGAIYC